MRRPRFTVSVSVFVVVKKEDKVLWLRRSGTGWLDGLYSIPAGAVDGGEPLLLAAAREAREEICVDIDPNNLRLQHVVHCRTASDEWIGCFLKQSAGMVLLDLVNQTSIVICAGLAWTRCLSRPFRM